MGYRGGRGENDLLGKRRSDGLIDHEANNGKGRRNEKAWGRRTWIGRVRGGIEGPDRQRSDEEWGTRPLRTRRPKLQGAGAGPSPEVAYVADWTRCNGPRTQLIHENTVSKAGKKTMFMGYVGPLGRTLVSQKSPERENQVSLFLHVRLFLRGISPSRYNGGSGVSYIFQPRYASHSVILPGCR